MSLAIVHSVATAFCIGSTMLAFALFLALAKADTAPQHKEIP